MTWVNELMSNTTVMLVDLDKLLQLDDVISDPGWDNWSGGPITREEIDKYIKFVLKNERPNPYDPDFHETREEHLARVAYYVVYGWGTEPICIKQHHGNQYIFDGIHRTIAAYFRNEAWIIAEIEGNDELIEYLTY